MKNFLEKGANYALVVSILMCIWIGDNIEATGKDIFTAFVILMLGVFIYLQKVVYVERTDKK